MVEAYKIGDLVWAKMKGFSPWPGKIIEPKDNVKKPSKKHKHFVYFFGSENFAWIEKGNVQPFFLKKDRLITQNKTIPFKEAVDAIEKYIVENNIEIPEIIKVEDRPTKSHHSETSVKKLKNTTPKTGKKRSIGEVSGTKSKSAKKVKTFSRLKDSFFVDFSFFEFKNKSGSTSRQTCTYPEAGNSNYRCELYKSDIERQKD
ncbi:UNVERIFIED_CONTAM: hypothetical protein RMT77_009061 [Armadillidium vulgare]